MFRSLVLSLLTLTLGMFFILIGQFKVTPKFFPDIHEDMVRIDLQVNVFLRNFIPLSRNVNSGVLIKSFPSIVSPAGGRMLETIAWL